MGRRGVKRVGRMMARGKDEKPKLITKPPLLYIVKIDIIIFFYIFNITRKEEKVLEKISDVACDVTQ